MGRPKKETIDIYTLILKLASKGFTNVEIADCTGLARNTIQNYLKDNSELKKSVQEVRAEALELSEEKKTTLNNQAVKAVSRLLKKRKTKEITVRKDAAGNIKEQIETTKELEPHAGITEFVLKNMNPKDWQKDTASAAAAPAAADNELKIIITDTAQGCKTTGCAGAESEDGTEVAHNAG